MAENQEVQVQQKREVDKAEESTTPTRAFLPTADIFETDNALTVVLEMPGVSKAYVDINIENGLLMVEGRIDFRKYEGCDRFRASTMSARTAEVFGSLTRL